MLVMYEIHKYIVLSILSPNNSSVSSTRSLYDRVSRVLHVHPLILDKFGCTRSTRRNTRLDATRSQNNACANAKRCDGYLELTI